MLTICNSLPPSWNYDQVEFFLISLGTGNLGFWQLLPGVEDTGDIKQ